MEAASPQPSLAPETTVSSLSGVPMGKSLTPVSDPPTRPAQEAANEKTRLTTASCTPYVLIPASKVRAGQIVGQVFSAAPAVRTLSEVSAVLKADSIDFVRRCDEFPGEVQVIESTPYDCLLGVVEALNPVIRHEVRRLLNWMGMEPLAHLSEIFDPEGLDARAASAVPVMACGFKGAIYSVLRRCGFHFPFLYRASKSALRKFQDVRSHLADDLIRGHTLYHNGVQTTHALLGEADVRSTPVDSKTRFLKAARAYRTPTEAQIRSRMPAPGKSQSTHPYLATARHLTVAGLRAMAAGIGAAQFDPCVSTNQRDKGAFGLRPVNQLKDLGHEPISAPESASFAPKVVRTLIECLAYESCLAEHSGHDIIIWTSHYPELAGETDESIYYADTADTFVEVIGKDKATAIYKEQCAWDFTSSDTVYIENEDHSAFTVYNVVRYPQPLLHRQVVFLCALQTVNLPYAIVNQLVTWTKGHDLGSVGIGTPGPCKNVILVPRDPAKPFTQDILVMANGTPAQPTVSIKYKHAISPSSCTTMTSNVYNYLKYLNAHGGRPLTVHEVTKRLELFEQSEGLLGVPQTAAYCELLRTVAWWESPPNTVYYGGGSGTTDEEPLESENAKAVLAAPRITNNNPGVSVKSAEAMEAYKREKLVGQRNTTVVSDQWQRISDVVLKNFIGGIARETGYSKGSLRLVDREEVFENRKRKAQIARQITDGMGPDKPEVGRVEQKVEVGHKTNPCPRGIQNPEYDVSIDSGVLAKSCELVMKKTRFYNPGCTPLEISESVSQAYDISSTHELHFGGGGMRSVDYTSADEKHCRHSFRVFQQFIDYFFCVEDKAEALRIYESCFNMPLQVGPKVMSSGMKNASGTGITTLLNTGVFAQRELETTAVAMVFRSMEDCGDLEPGEYIKSDDGAERPFPILTHKLFLQHLRLIQDTWELDKVVAGAASRYAIDLAYNWIGPKFGDDGLDPGTPYVSDGIYERAMLYVDRMDGFVRKLETTSAIAEGPVEYLSRIYPCPLRTPSSHCKVEKAIDKISIAINRDPERYELKLRGYWTTDRGTPIVGAYLSAIASMYGVKLSFITDEALLARLFEEDRELYWKMAAGPFPWNDGSSDELYACVAAEYDMSSGELREFDKRLRMQTTWAGIQEQMVPAKLTSETLEDPLGQASKSDPPGVARVVAFSTTVNGEDPRMRAFEPSDASAAGPISAPRTEAALQALQL